MSELSSSILGYLAMNVRLPRATSVVKLNKGSAGLALQTLIRLASAALQFAMLLVIVHNCSIEEFGAYSLATAIGTIVMTVVSMGLPQLLLRLNTHLGEIPAGTAVTWSWVASTGAGLISGAVAAAIIGHPNLIILAGTAQVTGESVSLCLQNYLFGALQAKKAYILQLCTRSIPIMGVLASLILGGSPVTGVAVGYLCAMPTIAVCAGCVPYSFRGISKVLVVGLRYWTTSVWGTIQQIDVTIITLLAGGVAAGSYAAAYRLVSPIHLVTTSLIAIYAPRLSRANTTTERVQIGRTLSTLGVSYAVVVSLIAPIVSIVGPDILGTQYENNSAAIGVFYVVGAVSVVNQIESTRLYAEGKTRAVAAGTMMGTVLSLTILAVLASVNRQATVLLVLPVLLGQTVLVIYLRLVLGRRMGVALGSSRSEY